MMVLLSFALLRVDREMKLEGVPFRSFLERVDRELEHSYSYSYSYS